VSRSGSTLYPQVKGHERSGPHEVSSLSKKLVKAVEEPKVWILMDSAFSDCRVIRCPAKAQWSPRICFWIGWGVLSVCMRPLYRLHPFLSGLRCLIPTAWSTGGHG
jgi:hypothetical protein